MQVFRTLVLDNSYQLAGMYPLDSNEIKGCIVHASEAMRKVYTDTATALVNYPVRIKTQSDTPYFWPSVIALNGWTKSKTRRVVMTKTNIYFRDGGKCQYCREHVVKYEMTLDHIVPTSKGGRHTWENVCLSCRDCNSRKSDAMPVGIWQNNRKYVKPSYESMIYARRNFPIKIFDPNWADYIGEWDAEIELDKRYENFNVQ